MLFGGFMRRKRIISSVLTVLVLSTVVPGTAAADTAASAAPNYKKAYAELLKKESLSYPERVQTGEKKYATERYDIHPKTMNYLLYDLNEDGTPELFLCERWQGDDCGFTSIYIYTCTATGKAVACMFKKTTYNGGSSPFYFESFVKSLRFSKAKKAMVFERASSYLGEKEQYSKRIYSVVTLAGTKLVYLDDITYKNGTKGKKYYMRNLSSGKVSQISKSLFEDEKAQFKGLKCVSRSPMRNVKANRVKSFGSKYA